MVDPHSGTLTFLLTDIEGSTAFWDRHPDEAHATVAHLEALMVDGVTTHGGQVIRSRGEGDSLFAVFARVSDAVLAACSIQRALCGADGTPTSALRVRMALHTGEAELRDGEYVGAVINRCGRIRSAAHGGQVLLSEASAALMRSLSLDHIDLRDLGECRFQGLSRPERVFQLIHPDLPTDFPPLRSAAQRSSSLPTPSTSLIGRERELAAVRSRLVDEGARLLVLTGPGGAGKTRLALKAAAELAGSFRDGVFFVPLAPIQDPALVASAIGHALSIREKAGRPVDDGLRDYLREKTLLLLLDSVEHLLPAAPLIAELLEGCPGLSVLATSRSVLHLYGEVTLVVPPLSLPSRSAAATIADLSNYEATRLFVERAQAARSDLNLTDDDARAIVEICHRLDGLPLAIELAAARMRLLDPQALLSRLDRRLPLLTGGARDRPMQQQTLRAAIAWSFDLLSPHEQQLLSRLAVFVGGWTLESAEAICTDAAEGSRAAAETVNLAAARQATAPILDGMASLVDQSLIRPESSCRGQRFTMLETIQEFALEQLVASGDARATRLRHVHHYLALAEDAERELTGAHQAAWLDQLTVEHDNLRAAIGEAAELGEIDYSLRIAGALWRFWQIRGHLREGRDRLTRLLALPTTTPCTAGRAKALNAAGFLVFLLGDYRTAQELNEESLAIRREIDDQVGIVESLHNLALTVRCRGDYPAARRYFEEGLAANRTLGNAFWAARLCNGLARVSFYEGDYAASRHSLAQSLAFGEEAGDVWGRAICLGDLSDVVRADGDAPEARRLLVDSLRLYHQLGDERGIAQSLEGFAFFASAEKRPERAVRLVAAATQIREAIGEPSSPARKTQIDEMLDAIRKMLEYQVFAATWAEGWSLSADEAVQHVLSVGGPTRNGTHRRARSATTSPWNPLTPREREVALLLARGLTNRQLADELVIGERTADAHVSNILNKLEFASRVQIAAWVIERGLGPQRPGD